MHFQTVWFLQELIQMNTWPTYNLLQCVHHLRCRLVATDECISVQKKYGFQLLCLGCLRVKELKVSTEGALKNSDNV